MTMQEFLDPKTQLLVAIGAATAAKCQPCFAKLYGAVEQVGASDQEVRAAVAIAVKVTAKSQDFMTAFIDETTKGAVPAHGEGAGAAGGCGCN
jgi:alkylhydroperoxidase/carboxymuconolactone decarboxylase family protein YurZ